jgi:hypothetical protein
MFFSRFDPNSTDSDYCIPIAAEGLSVTSIIIIGIVAIILIAVVVGARFFYKCYRKQGNMHCFSGGYLTIISFI